VWREGTAASGERSVRVQNVDVIQVT